MMFLALFLYVYKGMKNFDIEHDFGSIASKLMENRSANSAEKFKQDESLPHPQGFEAAIASDTALNSSLTNRALLLARGTNKKPDALQDNGIFLAKDIVQQIGTNKTLATDTVKNSKSSHEVTRYDDEYPSTHILTPVRLFRDKRLRVKHGASYVNRIPDCPRLPLVCKLFRLGTTSVTECDISKNCAENEFCCSAPCARKYLCYPNDLNNH